MELSLKSILFLCFFISSASFAGEFCDRLGGVQSEIFLKERIKDYFKIQAGKLNLDSDRFKTAIKTNTCSPNKYTKGLFLTFTGTGSFNPRVFNVLQSLMKCYNFEKLPSHLKRDIFNITLDSLKELNSSYTNWSATEAGPMTHLLRDAEIRRNIWSFDYATFPSEESEIIANPHNINFTYDTLKSIAREITDSFSNTPRPIVEALNCATSYISKVQEIGYRDNKIIIITHSSAGRMVVKFLEQLKKHTNKKVDLVITIDPVKEAHEAINEVIPQLAHRYSNDFLDYIPFYDPGYKEVNVWSRSQPHSLYKTSNAKRWINFYQTVDSKGLDIGLDFGIHGSPINNADHNYYITSDLGEGAHSELGYHDFVLDKIKLEVRKLMRIDY